MHGRAAVAQADIKQYYDNLRPLLIYRCLRQYGVQQGLCSTLLRLHCLPSLCIAVGHSQCEIVGRCFGVLTGTRSAAVMGRIPLADVAMRRMHVWRQLAFRAPGVNCCLGTFVDNLFTAAHDPHSAVEILRDAEVELQQRWRLHFGEDSKLVMSAREDLSVSIAGWKVMTSMRCLGHHLSGSCVIAKDFQLTTRAIWGAYWRSAGNGLRRASDRAQARFMNSSLKSVGGFRWSRWPWQKAYADRLDSLQRHIIGCIKPLRMDTGEDFDAYARRRRTHCERTALIWGKWSSLWASDVIKWDEHISRGNVPASWGLPLRQWHDSRWIQEQRLAHHGRTGTRAAAGHPATRWQDGVAAARAACRNL